MTWQIADKRNRYPSNPAPGGAARDEERDLPVCLVPSRAGLRRCGSACGGPCTMAAAAGLQAWRFRRWIFAFSQSVRVPSAMREVSRLLRRSRRPHLQAAGLMLDDRIAVICK